MRERERERERGAPGKRTLKIEGTNRHLARITRPVASIATVLAAQRGESSSVALAVTSERHTHTETRAVWLVFAGKLNVDGSGLMAIGMQLNLVQVLRLTKIGAHAIA